MRPRQAFPPCTRSHRRPRPPRRRRHGCRHLQKCPFVKRRRICGVWGAICAPSARAHSSNGSPGACASATCCAAAASSPAARSARIAPGERQWVLACNLPTTAVASQSVLLNQQLTSPLGRRAVTAVTAVASQRRAAPARRRHAARGGVLRGARSCAGCGRSGSCAERVQLQGALLPSSSRDASAARAARRRAVTAAAAARTRARASREGCCTAASRSATNHEHPTLSPAPRRAGAEDIRAARG